MIRLLTTTFSEARRLEVPRRVVLGLLGLRLVGAVMELVGLMILLPLFQFIQAHGDVAALATKHAEWAWATAATDAIGIPIGLETLLGSSFVLLMLRQLFLYVRLRYEVAVKEAASMRLRVAIFRGFVQAETRYQEGQAVGSVVSDMTIETGRTVEQLFGRIATLGVSILVLVYIVGLVTLSWTMTVAAVFAFALALLAVRRQFNQSKEASRSYSAATQQFADFLIERLKQARLIRLAGTERAEIAEMRRLTEGQRTSMVRIFNLLANLEVVMEPFVIGASFALIYVGIRVFGMPIEAVGLYLVILMRLQPVVKEFARYRQGVGSTQSSYLAVARRIGEMAAAKEQSPGTLPFRGVAEDIRFEKVSFVYPDAPKKPALQDISVRFPAHQLTALVGPSGAGKSTLVDLLPRLRTPQSGRILFDGTAIDDFDLASLRNGIAYAPQSPHIFDVTAAEHIGYGKPDATDAEIRHAAELAGADEFIRQSPQGYATRCGHGGSRLSGGQRQRLDLARALVRAAPILLLDEPTSNLDAESEFRFREALQRIRRETKTTIIVIAHRLSTISMADSVVVIEDGRVTAVGRHEDLIHTRSWYAEAYSKQTFLGANAARAAEIAAAPARVGN